MKTILVALDGSPMAKEVLARAVEVAQAFKARLTLFRAFHLSPELPLEIFLEPQDRMEAVLHRKTTHALEEIAATVPPELLAGIQVAHGPPWQTICDTARALKADLVVIGSHGYRLHERILGTTAARVVNHADQAVLVVRPR